VALDQPNKFQALKKPSPTIDECRRDLAELERISRRTVFGPARPGRRKLFDKQSFRSY